MEFDKINGMKVQELKFFLRLRGLKVSGRKCKLVAGVFAASENDVKLIKTAEQVEEQLREEYVSRLFIGDRYRVSKTSIYVKKHYQGTKTT